MRPGQLLIFQDSLWEAFAICSSPIKHLSFTMHKSYSENTDGFVAEYL